MLCRVFLLGIAISSTECCLLCLFLGLISTDTELLCDFYRGSAVFPSMLALEDTLTELQDFSILWFRELQLELTRAIQFPTTVSLPWLLVEQGLLLAPQLGVEPTISLLDVYNDAAHRSTFQLKKRFLCDEAVAEDSMCYDFLVHHVAEQVYLQEKSVAASPIEPELSDQRPSFRMRRGLAPASLAQRLVNVFGVEQRFSAHVALHVNIRVRKDLVAWVKKLERSDITSIAALERQLKVYQEAHCQLSYLELTQFKDVLDEVLGQHLPDFAASQTTRASSRVQRYVARALLSSLCQRFLVDFCGEQFVQSTQHPALTLETEYEEDPDRHEPQRDPEEQKQCARSVGDTRSGEAGSSDGQELSRQASFGYAMGVDTLLLHAWNDDRRGN